MTNFSPEGGNTQPPHNNNTEQPKKKITRRKFGIAALVAAGSVLGLGGIADYLINKNSTSSGYPRLLRTEDPAATALSQTATTGETRHPKNTILSPELIDRSLLSIGIIKIPRPGNQWIAGTGWIAKVEKDATNNSTDYFLVTPKHVVVQTDLGLSFARPGIDSDFLTPDSFSIATSAENDLAVIKLSYNSSKEHHIPALAFEDNALLLTNDNVLLIGFPKEFSQSGLISSQPQVTPTTVGDPSLIQHDKNTFYMFVPGGAGDSGAPILINKNGIPTVVGMITSGESYQASPDAPLQPIETATYLDIKQVIGTSRS